MKSLQEIFELNQETRQSFLEEMTFELRPKG